MPPFFALCLRRDQRLPLIYFSPPPEHKYDRPYTPHRIPQTRVEVWHSAMAFRGSPIPSQAQYRREPPVTPEIFSLMMLFLHFPHLRPSSREKGATPGEKMVTECHRLRDRVFAAFQPSRPPAHTVEPIRCSPSRSRYKGRAGERRMPPRSAGFFFDAVARLFSETRRAAIPRREQAARGDAERRHRHTMSHHAAARYDFPDDAHIYASADAS